MIRQCPTTSLKVRHLRAEPHRRPKSVGAGPYPAACAASTRSAAKSSQGGTSRTPWDWSRCIRPRTSTTLTAASRIMPIASGSRRSSLRRTDGLRALGTLSAPRSSCAPRISSSGSTTRVRAGYVARQQGSGKPAHLREKPGVPGVADISRDINRGDDEAPNGIRAGLRHGSALRRRSSGRVPPLPLLDRSSGAPAGERHESGLGYGGAAPDPSPRLFGGRLSARLSGRLRRHRCRAPRRVGAGDCAGGGGVGACCVGDALRGRRVGEQVGEAGPAEGARCGEGVE